MKGPASDTDPTPADLLGAWRDMERRRATGGDDAPALTAAMRLLMDRYDWAIGGRVGPDPGASEEHIAPGHEGLRAGRPVAGLSAT